jgi:hypothetical protein
LHVDNELRKFTLWQANPTRDARLVPVNHKIPSPACAGPAPTTQSSSSSTVTANSSESDSGGRGSSPSFLILLVVVGVAVLALGIGFFVRHRKQRKLPPAEPSAIRLPQDTHSHPEEMDSGPPHEVHPTRVELPAQEVSVHEAPANHIEPLGR